MKNSIEISFPEQSATAAFGGRLVTLSDGRQGVRSTMPIEIHEPAQARSLSPSHGERAGERGLEVAPADRTGPPLPSDGRGVRGEGHSSSDNQPILDFISSDETLDRCGEIISADGWRLESYRRNPVFQNAHQYGDIIFTLGRALITEVRHRIPREAPRELSTLNSQPSTYLFQRIQFATEANPMARIAYALYKGKFLNAVSVGFIPLRWEDGDAVRSSLSTQEREDWEEEAPSAHAPAAPRQTSVQLSTLNYQQSTNFRRRYLEQELLEVSAVGIPANPNALQLGLKAGAIKKSDLQELLDLLRSLCDSKSGVFPQLSTINSQPNFRSQSAVPNTLAGASGVRSYEAQWLRLARQVREVMRDA